MEIQHFNSLKLSLHEDDLEKFVGLKDDLFNVIYGDKKFMAEHTIELLKKYEEFAQKKETETITKPHNTEWHMSTCCIFTTNFQEASEQEICICLYIAYSQYQHYFTCSIIKTTHTGSPCITISYLNLRIPIATFMKSLRMAASHSNEH